MPASRPGQIDANRLKAWIHDEAELALLDVREHGQYGEGHLFFAVSVPYSSLEIEIGRLVPNRTVRVVVYGFGDDDPVVDASADILARLEYRDVHVLQGGIAAWRQAGHAVFAGVNLPSKTFGELAEQVYHTPHVSAADLHAMLGDPARNIVVVDGRPVAEYRKMNIPGAVCCPNGELALRIAELAPDPDTTIVVNCAGRTRSIIGAQTLINLGLPNKVYALENGTQGWYLADYALEHRSDRLYPETIAESALPALRERAETLARRFGLARASGDEVRQWLTDGSRTVFICDIRTEQEFHESRLPAVVRHTPGGQLVQATDQYVGVRKARIVLYDADGIRAPVIASWLKQLGWEVYLLADLGPLSGLPDEPADLLPLSHARRIAAGELADTIRRKPETLVLDARPSQDFRQTHLEGSPWVIRPILKETVAGHSGPILLLGPDEAKLVLLAADLEHAGHRDVTLATATTDDLKHCGLPLGTDPGVLPDAACIDYLFFVHDRHDGNKEAARRYLEWETGLVAQLDEKERASFSIGFRPGSA